MIKYVFFDRDSRKPQALKAEIEAAGFSVSYQAREYGEYLICLPR